MDDTIDEYVKLQKELKELQDKSEGLHSKKDKLEQELTGKTDEEIAKNPDQFEKLADQFKETVVDQEKADQALSQKTTEFEQFKKSNPTAGQEVTDIYQDMNATHKERTGKDLDQNVYGYGENSVESKPITPEIANQAKEVVEPIAQSGTISTPNQSLQPANNAQETDSNTQTGNSSIIDQTRQKANSTPEIDNNLNKEAETIQQADAALPVPEQSPQSSSNAQTTVSDTPQAGNSSLVDQTKENASKAQEQPITEKEKSLSEKTQAQNRDDDLER